MKNPAPLSWAWFGAVRLERKPLACEDTHRLLKYHTHNLQKPPAHYLEPPPLPPEDLEPISDKPADTPSSVDQSPAAGGRGRGKNKGKRKQPKPGPGPAGPPMHLNPMGPMGQPQMGQTGPGAPPGMQMPMQPTNPQMGHMGGYGPAGMQQQPQQNQQYANTPSQQWYNNQQQGAQSGYYPPMPGKTQ